MTSFPALSLFVQIVDEKWRAVFVTGTPGKEPLLAGNRSVYITKRKLRSGLKIIILFSRLLTRCALS